MGTLHKSSRLASSPISAGVIANGVIADRFKNLADLMTQGILAGKAKISIDELAKPDAEFMLDVFSHMVGAIAIDGMTPEKKSLLRRIKSKVMFTERLEMHGGAISSRETADLLGVSKVTVKKRKDEGKLLALEINNEFYYPVLQFSDSPELSEQGVLKGIAELLPQIQAKGFSDRMQFSFFVEKRNTVLNGMDPGGRTFTVAELLKEGPSDTVMQELHRLARLFGTQDLA